jgi:protein associated with RNAse G/E
MYFQKTFSKLFVPEFHITVIQLHLTTFCLIYYKDKENTDRVSGRIFIVTFSTLFIHDKTKYYNLIALFFENFNKCICNDLGDIFSFFFEKIGR